MTSLQFESHEARVLPSAHVLRAQPVGRALPLILRCGEYPHLTACHQVGVPPMARQHGGWSGGWGAVRSEVKEEARASAWAGGHERSTVPQSPDLAVKLKADAENLDRLIERLK